MPKTIEQIDAQASKQKTKGQSEEDKKIVQELEELFQTAKMAKADIEADIQEALDEYENILDGSTDGLANVQNPILFSVVQTKISEELASAPQIRFFPKTREDVERVEYAKAAYYDSTTRGRFNYNVFKCFLAKDIVGTGIGCEEMITKKRQVRDLVMDKKGDYVLDKQGNIKEKKRTIYDVDDLVLRYVDVRRFFPDPAATDMESAAWTFELEEVDYTSFLMYASNDETYIQENVSLVLPDNNFDFSHPFGLPFQNNEEKGKSTANYGARSKSKVLLIKYMNKIRDQFMIVANGILVKDMPNPYAHKQLPYVRFVNHMELDSFWGRSEYRILKQTIQEKNNFRNMMTDWSKININRPILLGNTDFEDEDIQFGPGAIWEVSDINQVKLLDLGDIPNGIFGMENKMDEDVVSFTGIDSRSLVSSGEESATRSALKNEKALKRIGMGLRVVDWTALEPFAKMRLSNIQQFYTQKRLEMVTDEKGNLKAVAKFRDVRVPDKEVVKDKDGNIRFVDNKGGFGFFESRPEYINAQVDVEAVTGSTLNASKEVDRQNFNATLQAIAAFPELRAVMNWRNVGEMIARKSNEDPSKLLIEADGNQGDDMMDSDMSTEDFLAKQGVAAPGQPAPGEMGDVAPGMPTADMLSQLFNTVQPDVGKGIGQPGGPQPGSPSA